MPKPGKFRGHRFYRTVKSTSVERLRRTRAVVRESVTRTLSLLAHPLRDTYPDSTDLQVHLEFLVQKETQLTHLNEQIGNLLDDDDLESGVIGTLENNMNVCHANIRVC